MRDDTPFGPPPDDAVSTAQRRVPWGFWHLIVIFGLSIAGWLVAIVLVIAGLALIRFRTGSMPSMDTLGFGLGLTVLLYFILYLAIIAVVRSCGGWDYLGYRVPGWRTMLGVVALLPIWYGVLFATGAASAYVINHGKPIPSNVTGLFGPGGLKGITPAVIVLVIVVAAVVAPIVEEALFRGVLYQWLRGRIGVVPAVVLDGGLFASAHLVSGVAGLWKLLPMLFVMGCLLAIVFQRTRSLFASMLLHATNNALAVALLLVTMRR